MKVTLLRSVRACFLTAAIIAASGCALILGEADSGGEPGPPLSIGFVESLRNQESLRGGSYGEQLAGQTAIGSLQRPSAVYADEYRVYVTDTYLHPPTISSARIFVFDRSAATVSVLNINTLFGGNEGKLLDPSGIVVDQGYIIFVSDSQLGKVFGYNRNGTVVTSLGRSLTASQAGYGDIAFPLGLALDRKRSRIYVADSQTVKAFTTTGVYLFEISGGGGKDFRSASAVSVDREGNVFILDRVRRRVSIFDPDGAFIRSFSLRGAADGRNVTPSALAVDSGGHVYVTDTFNNCVFIFDKDGTFLSTWGRTGVLTGDFWTPAGIFIDDSDLIYIADQTNGRIQTFRYLKQAWQTPPNP